MSVTSKYGEAIEAPAAKRAFSHEIHGVRGLALGMVVLFHLFGGGKVSGGVDVFLVISAYLITGSMLKALRSSQLSLVQRYGRTFSRLLPPALLTIFATTLVGIFLLPRTSLESLFAQASAAAVFRENIYLASTGLSYEAAGDSASPFQHFWSLSMQGQFLLAWPALTLVLILLLRGVSPRLRVAVFGGLAVLMTILSFIYAAEAVNVDQAAAYYSLTARLWEFGLGFLAAFVAPSFPRDRRWLGWIGWGGVLLIVTSGFVVDGATTFPGPWALWPVTGTLLVLFSADSGGAQRVGLTKVLSLKPIVWLANRGYPLYLWHWPLLIFFMVYFKASGVGLAGAAAVLGVSLGLSELTMRLVSKPFVAWSNHQQKSKAGQIRVLATLVALAALLGAGTAAAAASESRTFARQLQDAADQAATRAIKDQPMGAVQQGLAPPVSRDELLLTPEVTAADLPEVYDWNCIQDWREGDEYAEVLICTDGTMTNRSTLESKSSDGRKRVVLIGASHSIQFYPAIRVLADAEDWELLVIGKSACRFAVPSGTDDVAQACNSWRETAMEEVLELHPDLVLTLGSVTSSNIEQDERVDPGQVAAWIELADHGIPVGVFRDTPRFPGKVPPCVLVEDDYLEVCGTQASELFLAESPLKDVGAGGDIFQIDLTDALCADDYCPPIIGNLIPYRDAHHLSATFTKTLAPDIKAVLLERVPLLFD